MNCRDFEKNVLALARGQLLEAAVRARGLAHAEVCARCSSRLAEERALLACARAAAEEMAGEGAPPRVGAALLAAFREHVETSSARTAAAPPRALSHRTRWLPAAAVAAVLILIPVVAVFRLHSRAPNRNQGERAATLPAPSGSSAPESGGAQSAFAARGPEIASRPRRVRTRERARRRAPTRRPSAVEEVTEYVPLLDGVEIDSLEAVQVVRVELPASALTDVGVRADAGSFAGPVKADVLLGHDGLARAIRFVR